MVKLPYKYSVNVQDGNKNIIAGASVNVTGSEFTASGMTDDRGCYIGTAELDKLYTMVITKSGFIAWAHKFTLALQADPLHPVYNFPVKVVNSSNTPIIGAKVSITSLKPHSNTGSTITGGIYKGIVERDFLNSIIISKSGFQTYINEFFPYTKIDCLDKLVIAIPVITLNPIIIIDPNIRIIQTSK